jgi:hypothetical protein
MEKLIKAEANLTLATIAQLTAVFTSLHGP